MIYYDIKGGVIDNGANKFIQFQSIGNVASLSLNFLVNDSERAIVGTSDHGYIGNNGSCYNVAHI